MTDDWNEVCFNGLHWQVGNPEKERIPVAWHKAVREVWPARFIGLSVSNNLSKEPQILQVMFSTLYTYSNMLLREAEEEEQDQ